jgi:hypothetical protein
MINRRYAAEQLQLKTDLEWSQTCRFATPRNSVNRRQEADCENREAVSNPAFLPPASCLLLTEERS